METPSSTIRVTRSQTLATLNNNSITLSKGNKEEYVKGVSKTNGKQQSERGALIDITNDSPIVGLAMETPSSAVGKQWSSRVRNVVMTPGSGEALLRGQVKTLLQKVEEEAELSTASMESRPFIRLQGCVNSPMGISAPTPANTPQLSNLYEDIGLGSIVTAQPVVEEHMKRSEEVRLESQKSVITRSLLLDFAEHSSYSEVTDQEKVVHAKRRHQLMIMVASKMKMIGKEPFEEMGDVYYEEVEDNDDDDGEIDELCEGLSKISMEEMFRGKHTRFVYDSDDEIEREEGKKAMQYG
ncbi:Chalcone-flavanone isomerase family protein [Hibiscus syriacus]|uniref:Chalcone-flavanone isomerase family protein n=1 Tax=Hibiscus syriacus TaxID=106335 RepID=A0A6A2Z4F2_HIBSY|nr:Chalcone-flavanone isomerase family protein [Hibiscus syriacus]